MTNRHLSKPYILSILRDSGNGIVLLELLGFLHFAHYVIDRRVYIVFDIIHAQENLVS